MVRSLLGLTAAVACLRVLLRMSLFSRFKILFGRQRGPECSSNSAGDGPGKRTGGARQAFAIMSGSIGASSSAADPGLGSSSGQIHGPSTGSLPGAFDALPRVGAKPVPKAKSKATLSKAGPVHPVVG